MQRKANLEEETLIFVTHPESTVENHLQLFRLSEY